MSELEAYAGFDCLNMVKHMPLFEFKRRLNEIRKEQPLLFANPIQNSHQL